MIKITQRHSSLWYLDDVEDEMKPLITVVSGIRDIVDESTHDVELALCDELGMGCVELRFGGALGVDSLALGMAAHLGVRHRRAVYVPFRVSDQPREARAIIKKYATKIYELAFEKSPWAYLRRNDAMLKGAHRLLAFTDGRETGGTAYTLRMARELGLDITVVPVLSTKTVRDNPWIRDDLFEGIPVFGYSSYVSREVSKTGISEVIRKMKLGTASRASMASLAADLVKVVEKDDILRSSQAIIAMPRREPGVESDLQGLVALMAKALGMEHPKGWLVRARRLDPAKGLFRQKRIRFLPEQHAASLAVKGPPFERVLLLDNVLTTGGTLAGAVRAIRRDCASEIACLCICYSRSIETEA